jgi:hypothetical protein
MRERRHREGGEKREHGEEASHGVFLAQALAAEIHGARFE